MNWLKNLFRIYLRAVKGRCMIHDVPMLEQEADYGAWAATELVCPVCVEEKLKAKR